MSRSIALIFLFGCSSLQAADPQTLSEKLAKHLGPAVVDSLNRVDKVEAFKVGDLDPKQVDAADRVSGRIIVGEPVVLTADQTRELLQALRADDTYFRASSLGTTRAAVGYRLWTDKKECLEISCCLNKGNLRMTMKDASGKVTLDKGIGGFRDDKTSPMRTIAAALFPNDKDITGAVPKKK